MTEKRYWQVVEQLKKGGIDAYLLASLNRGYSAVNVVYANKAVEKLSTQVVEDVRVVGDYVERGLVVASDNTVLRGIEKEIRETYRELFVARKSFFDFPFLAAHDIDRARVSSEVQKLQREIALLKERKEVYLETGQLPEKAVVESDDEVFVMPETSGARLAGLLSKRASLSRLERQYREMVARGETDAAKLTKKERTRIRLKIAIKLLEKAVESDKDSAA